MGLVFGHQSAQPIALSTVLQTALLTSLTSAQSSIEHFLRLPTASYPHLSELDWKRLIHATFILYKLCLGPPNFPSWDASSARTVVRLDLHLDALCLRLQNLRTHSAARDLYSMLPAVFTSVRDAYTVLRDEAKPDIARAPHAGVLQQKARVKRKKTLRMACPALVAWSVRGDAVVAGGDVGVNGAESVAMGGEDLGCVVDNEAWLFEGGGLLSEMEGTAGVEFWEQVSRDQTLWGVGDEFLNG